MISVHVVTASLPLGPFDHLLLHRLPEDNWPCPAKLHAESGGVRGFDRFLGQQEMAVPCSACHVRRALSITREKRVSRKLVAHSRVHREKLEIFQTCWPTARDIEGLPIASFYGFYGITVYHDYLRLKVFVCVCV